MAIELANIRHWPIFLSDDKQLMTAEEVLWPSDEFCSIPKRIRKILRQGIEHIGATSNRDGSQLRLLNAQLENILYGSEASLDFDVARLQAEKARALNGVRVVTLKEAAFAYFTCVEGLVDIDSTWDCSPVIDLFRWALEGNLTHLISHVFTDSNQGGLRLKPIQFCYIGVEYDETETTKMLQQLFSTEGITLDYNSFVSEIYLKDYLKSNQGIHILRTRAQYAEFLTNCGAQTNVSLEIRVRPMTKREHSSKIGLFPVF